MDKLLDAIRRLKKEKNALVLAHYYQDLSVWEAADFVGDSLELSRKAAAAKEDIIVFCGVRFMAESAKILNPKKKVLLPVATAGCPMADMISAEDVRALREKFPGSAVVCYVNSSAEVKAESDICCTSAGAVKVVASLPQKDIIFIPDKNLGSFVAAQFPEKNFHFIDGYCVVHNRITERDILEAKAAHPNALLAMHPECSSVAGADFVGSTTGILNFCRTSAAEEFIIGTEKEIVRKLQQEFPQKAFYSMGKDFVCQNMKKTSLYDLLFALEEEKYEIELDESVRERAFGALDAMIRL